MLNYTLKRSRRKTLAIQITREAQVVVRAPERLPLPEIERFLASRAQWIQQNQDKQRQWRQQHPEPDAQALQELKEKARQEIPPRVAYYAEKMGLQPTAVKITAARSRFGSCSAQNSLCFSCRLMQYPLVAIDYVVVHELAHLVHKNHGPQFYALVAAVLPDYQARRALLKG